MLLGKSKILSLIVGLLAISPLNVCFKTNALPSYLITYLGCINDRRHSCLAHYQAYYYTIVSIHRTVVLPKRYVFTRNRIRFQKFLFIRIRQVAELSSDI